MSLVSEPELSFEAPEPNSVRYYETRHQLIETNLDTLSVSLTASVVSVKKNQECVDSQPVSTSTTPLIHTPVPPPTSDSSYPEKPSSLLISEAEVQPLTVPLTDKSQKKSEEFQSKELDNNVSAPVNERTGRYPSLEEVCCEIIVFFSECCMCYGNKA